MPSLWLAWALMWAALNLTHPNARGDAPTLPQALAIAGIGALATGARERTPATLAVAFVTVALLIALAARASLGKSWAGGPAPIGPIVRTGLYARARHPIYIAIATGALATAAASRSPRDLIGAGMIASGLAWAAHDEDRAINLATRRASTRGEKVVQLDEWRE